MHKQLDFAAKAAKARKMTDSQLDFARRDCIACVDNGVDPDYYRDEASVYADEIRRRANNRRAA